MGLGLGGLGFGTGLDNITIVFIIIEICHYLGHLSRGPFSLRKLLHADTNRGRHLKVMLEHVSDVLPPHWPEVDLHEHTISHVITNQRPSIEVT